MSKPFRSRSWVRSRACSSAVRTSTVDRRQWWASPTGSVPSRGTDSSTGARRVVGEQAHDGLRVPHVDGKQHGVPSWVVCGAGSARVDWTVVRTSGSSPRSSTGAEWVSAPADSEVGAGGGQGRCRGERHAARHLHQGVRARRPRTTATASATCSGPMLSSMTTVAPAATASPPGPARSHSTSTMRPGHWARARRHRLGDRGAAQVVVLDQHRLGQAAPVVRPHRRPAQPPSPAPAARAWSCGCRGPVSTGWPPARRPRRHG